MKLIETPHVKLTVRRMTRRECWHELLGLAVLASIGVIWYEFYK